MLHAKNVKQEGLLHSTWLQHNFAIPEMLERRGTVPRHPPLSTHWASQRHYGGQKKDKWFMDWLQLPVQRESQPQNWESWTILIQPDSSCCHHRWPVPGSSRYSRYLMQTPHCSHDLQHHHRCNVTLMMQDVWTQGSLINSQALSEEAEAAEASWLPPGKAGDSCFVYLPGFGEAGPLWCVLSTRNCTNTDNIPGTLRVFLVSVEPFLTNIRAAPPSWTWKSSISWGQALSYNIINYLIENHQPEAGFSL